MRNPIVIYAYSAFLLVALSIVMIGFICVIILAAFIPYLNVKLLIALDPFPKVIGNPQSKRGDKKWRR